MKVHMMTWRFRHPKIALLINAIKNSFRFLLMLYLTMSIARFVLQLDKQGVLGTYGVLALLTIIYMYFLNLNMYNNLKSTSYQLPDVESKLIEAQIQNHEDWYKWATMSAFDLWEEKQDMRWKHEHEYFDFILDVQVIVLSLFLIVLCLQQLI